MYLDNVVLLVFLKKKTFHGNKIQEDAVKR